MTIAVIGYVGATGLALAYLVQREELIYRLAALATLAGWVAHTVGLIVQVAALGRPPFGTLSEAVSVSVWFIVLLEMWIERHYAVKVLGAFVLPIVLTLSVSILVRPLSLTQIGPALRNAWIWVHIVLALVGIAAFVLNFAGAIMYLLQERQLKIKRPGAFYYRLPALETLDRLTYRTLALGFPFLTTGLILGALWAGTAWGTIFTFDPLAVFSLVAWIIYAGTLAGRAAAGCTDGAPRTLPSPASPRSPSRSAPGCSCPGATVPDGPLRRRAQSQDGPCRSARAARRGGAQAP